MVFLANNKPMKFQIWKLLKSKTWNWNPTFYVNLRFGIKTQIWASTCMANHLFRQPPYLFIPIFKTNCWNLFSFHFVKVNDVRLPVFFYVLSLCQFIYQAFFFSSYQKQCHTSLSHFSLIRFIATHNSLACFRSDFKNLSFFLKTPLPVKNHHIYWHRGSRYFLSSSFDQWKNKLC